MSSKACIYRALITFPYTTMSYDLFTAYEICHQYLYSPTYLANDESFEAFPPRLSLSFPRRSGSLSPPVTGGDGTFPGDDFLDLPYTFDSSFTTQTPASSGPSFWDESLCAPGPSATPAEIISLALESISPSLPFPSPLPSAQSSHTSLAPLTGSPLQLLAPLSRSPSPATPTATATSDDASSPAYPSDAQPPMTPMTPPTRPVSLNNPVRGPGCPATIIVAATPFYPRDSWSKRRVKEERDQGYEADCSSMGSQSASPAWTPRSPPSPSVYVGPSRVHMVRIIPILPLFVYS